MLHLGPRLLPPTTIVTELPTKKGPSSVVTRSSVEWTHGHGKTFWMGRVPTHGRRSWLKGSPPMGRATGDRRQQVKGASALREHGWQGSPRGSPKNVLGRLSQVGDVSQLPGLAVARAGTVLGREAHHVPCDY
jgi:hypothetical protein